MYGPNITAKALTQELTWAVKDNYLRPIMIWGAPGLGKTRLTEQLAHSCGIEHRVFRICDKSPVEINGVPVPGETTTRWLPPEGLPKEGKGILLIDEIVRAPFTMQGIAQQLIHERRTMSYTLPEGWFVFATGNRKSDRTGSFDMPADVANRFDHYTLVPDLESTLEYFVQQGVHEDIIGFLRFRPELLHRFDKDAVAWPSPRTWFENAWPRLEAGRSLAPALGEGTAAEFSSYRDLQTRLARLDADLGGPRNYHPLNVAEHSFQVAVVAHALAIIGVRNLGREYDPANVALAALLHDASEVLTGDLPPPVKYANPEMRTAYKGLEQVATERLLGMLPEELRDDYAPLLRPPDPEIVQIVKAADKLCALLKCVQEVGSGNREFVLAEAALRGQLETLDVPEASYFLEHYGSSFSLSLDDLQDAPPDGVAEP